MRSSTAASVPAASGTAVTTEPSPPSRTATSSGGGSGACSITTNAGNCYKAGEYCRKSDIDRSTTDAHGQPITCTREGVDGSQPHWR
ncbi:hypothetical protein [Kitasatospora sp. P5_F3]